ncbi:MAG TPA: DUF3618 domain-containing protein [Bryobacteraceae bacterium]
MAEEPNQIKRHIDATRDELGENVHELGRRVKEATDWRTYFDKSPMTMLALAFAGGVVVSTFVGRPGTHRNGHHPLSQGGDGQPHRGVQYRKSEAADLFDTVKGAVIGWTANQFKTVLDELLPGFRQQYERTENEKRSHTKTPEYQRPPFG